MGGSASKVPKVDNYPEQPVSVDELLPLLSTGDIILFRGCGTSAWWVRLWEMCNYSHVGMVHKRVLDGHSEPTVCVWESVGHLDNMPCLLHGRLKSGPRLCIIKMQPHRTEDSIALDQHLSAFEDYTCGRSSYPGSSEVVAGAIGLWKLPMGDDTVSQWQGPGVVARVDYTCEQLIAATLVRMQAYSASLDVNRIHLNSFIDGSILETHRRRAVLDQVNYHWTVKPSSPGVITPMNLLPPPPPGRSRFHKDSGGSGFGHWLFHLARLVVHDGVYHLLVKVGASGGIVLGRLAAPTALLGAIHQHQPKCHRCNDRVSRPASWPDRARRRPSRP